MRELMFEVPSDSGIAEIVVEKDAVTEGKPPTVKRTNESIAEVG